MIISLIVAMDKNRVIGHNNQLPWHLPVDLKHFKKVTMGKPIVMGRKTFESIGKPLPGRRNIILTRNREYRATGAEVFYSLDEALTALALDHTKNSIEEVMIIGGATIFNEALSIASQIYLTRIDHEFEGDTFFPEIDKLQWKEVSSEDHLSDEKNQYRYSFLLLERKML